MEAKDKLEMLLDYTDLKILPFSKSIGQGSQTFYDIRSGKIQNFTVDVANKIIKKYPEINKEWLIAEELNMLKRPPDKTTDALQQLEKIQNGKPKNAGEGKIVNEDEVIKIKTYIIPMKGFAGLKNAIYDDQYITENFEESTTEVPKHLYSPVSYRIQSSGDSMPASIPNNAWVTAVPVPEMIWMTYKFLPKKIYVLFHPYRGILFKHVKNMPFDEIELSSQNKDKDEFPVETFKITEFRKILLAIKVENFL